MSPEYISYITIIGAFASGVGLSALTFGTYCLRGWCRELDRAQREREAGRKRGVYRVVNTAIGAQYIGSTTRAFAARWGEHIAYLEAGTHINKAWQRDWQIYGPDAFSFTVLESSNADEARIRDREQDWISAAHHELPPHLIYNREGFRSAKPSSSVQAAILALRLHLARDAGDPKAYDHATVDAVRVAAMHAALAPRQQRGVK